MKNENLTAEQLEGLSDLLVGTDSNNIEVGFQILASYPQHVKELQKELVLVSKLAEDEELKEQAKAHLVANFSKKDLSRWNREFKVFDLYDDLYNYDDFEKHWKSFEQHEKIRPDYIELIKKNKFFAEEYYYLGERIADYYPKRTDIAEIYCQIPLECNPQNLDALNRLATLYKDTLGDYEKAIDCYDRMLVIDYKNKGALTQKAGLCMDYGNYSGKSVDKAIALLQEALGYYPNDYYIEVWLADAMIEKNTPTSFVDGMKILEEATKKHPSRSTAWVYYGNNLWIKGGKIKEAEEAYLAGIENNPYSCLLLGNLAELYDNEYQNHEKAEEYYDQALDVSPNDKFHLTNYIALLVLDLGKYEKASEYYEDLKRNSYQTVKQEPSITDKQFQKFEKAQDILWEKYPELKKF